MSLDQGSRTSPRAPRKNVAVRLETAHGLGIYGFRPGQKIERLTSRLDMQVKR
jgi:hypothetical protein